MSGIDKMKEKIRSKMTMDDLPSPKHEDKIEHKNEKAHSGKVESNLNSVEAPIKQANKSETTNELPPLFEEIESQNSHPNLLQTAMHTKPDLKFEELTKIDLQPRKATFYISQEMHTAFNDIYAKKILSGRQITKSELITEAVALLVEKEKNV